jgi:membrane fusion protein (multidrug efflux system)
MRAVLACATAACLTFGCSSKTSEAAEPPPQFPVATPTVKDTVVDRAYVAEIRAVRHAELRSRFKGILETVGIDEGQRVKAGQTLFTVNARALKQEVLVAKAATLGAEAELAAADLELKNTRLLQEKRVVSEAEVALSASKVQTLRAKVQEAKASAARAAVELGFAEVKAPFDGVINRVPHKAGSAIGEDELLTTLTDTSEVFAYFRLTEREYLAYAATTAAAPTGVTLQLVDGTPFPAKGTIDAIASELDRETGTLTYRARFANPTGILRHGSSGKVILTTDLHDALLVPQKATFDVQGNIYLYVVDANNVPHARKLVVGARIGDAFVVEQGLAKTERFVVEGVHKVKDGVRIDVVGG